MESFAIWACLALGVVGMLGFVYVTARDFGLSGVLVKVALATLCIFFTLLLAAHQPQWTAIHKQHKPFGTEATVGIGTVLMILVYLIADERPMRWLLKPWVKWTLYVAGACAVLGIHAVRKGWV